MNRGNPGTKRWHILGAGSMGCLWASLLRAQGHDVTLLLKDQSVAEQYQRAGCISLERAGTTMTMDCQIELADQVDSWDPQESPTSLIISTKAYDTLAALRAVGSSLQHYRALILIQNGMGTVAEVEREFPGLPLFAGVTAHGAWRRSRFHVVHAGEGPTWIGPAVERKPPLARELTAPFLDLAAQIGWDAEILPRMWTKVAINCVINGLTVLLQCRNGEILADAHRPRIEQLCAEAEQVLAAELSPRQDFNLLDQVNAIATATASNFSSMLQDVQQGRRTEVEYINGHLCRAAARHGIDTPEQARLFAELLQLLS